MLDQMMTTSNLLSILWFRCVGCDARICSRFHLFVHFVSCAFTANLRDNNKATIQRTHTKFQGVVTPNRTRKISLKTRKNWERKKNTKYTKSNINYRSLTQFKCAHFVRFKPSNDLSICKYTHAGHALYIADQQKGVPSFSWIWRLQINMIFSFSFFLVNLLSICFASFAIFHLHTRMNAQAHAHSIKSQCRSLLLLFKKSAKCYWNTNTSP